MSNSSVISVSMQAMKAIKTALLEVLPPLLISGSEVEEGDKQNLLGQMREFLLAHLRLKLRAQGLTGSVNILQQVYADLCGLYYEARLRVAESVKEYVQAEQGQQQQQQQETTSSEPEQGQQLQQMVGEILADYDRFNSKDITSSDVFIIQHNQLTQVLQAAPDQHAILARLVDWHAAAAAGKQTWKQGCQLFAVEKVMWKALQKARAGQEYPLGLGTYLDIAPLAGYVVEELGAEWQEDAGWYAAVEDAIDFATVWLKQLINQKYVGEQQPQQPQQRHAPKGFPGWVEQLVSRMVHIGWSPNPLRMPPSRLRLVLLEAGQGVAGMPLEAVVQHLQERWPPGASFFGDPVTQRFCQVSCRDYNLGLPGYSTVQNKAFWSWTCIGVATAAPRNVHVQTLESHPS